MTSVAVDTDRGIQVPLAEHGIMYALEGLRILIAKWQPPAAFRGADYIILLLLNILSGCSSTEKPKWQSEQ
jgi:hypothetical protein